MLIDLQRASRKVAIAVLAGILVGGGCASDTESDKATTLPTPPATITDRSQIVEYYVALGATEPVADCIADVLVELDVTSFDELEADQALGAEAAARFEICTQSNGERSTEE